MNDALHVIAADVAKCRRYFATRTPRPRPLDAVAWWIMYGARPLRWLHRLDRARKRRLADRGSCFGRPEAWAICRLSVYRSKPER